MHIFLTGGSGFAGKNLIPYLMERECRLTCLLRVPERLPSELRSRVTVVVGDISNLGAEAEAALKQADAVVHLAGQLWGRSYKDYDRVNRVGTETLVRAAAGVPLQRFVYLSSLAAAGPSRLGEPLTEASEAAPVSWYGRSKLAGEQVLTEAPFPWTVIRAPAIYGPHDLATLIFYRLAANHIQLNIRGGRPEHSIMHVNDLCQAIWLVLTEEKRPQSTYFVHDGQPIHQLEEIMTHVQQAVGKWALTVPVPGWLVKCAESALTLGQRFGLAPARVTPDKLRELRHLAWTCSSDQIANNLGYRPQVSLAEGIRETAAWYRNEGWL